MKHISFKKSFALPLCACALLATSCIKEDLADCQQLTLKVVNDKGDDITALGKASVVTLFVYDANMKQLEARQLDAASILSRQPIELNYPDGSKLNLVAWANLRGNQTVAEGSKMTDLTVMLKSESEKAQSPDSLFYGMKEVQVFGNGVAGGNQEIIIEPKCGNIEMKTIGLDKYLGKAKRLKSSETFNFYMDRTLSGFDYTGKLIGDSVYYNPAYVNDTNGFDIKSAEQDNVVAGENLTFRFSLDGDEEYAVAADDNGKPLTTTPYNLTSVIFEFGENGFIGAKVTVTPWGEVDDDHEF